MRKSFGQVLKKIRKEKGISQETLALEAGIDRSYVGRLERDLNDPTISMLFTIAKVLKVRPSEIIAKLER